MSVANMESLLLSICAVGGDFFTFQLDNHRSLLRQMAAEKNTKNCNQRICSSVQFLSAYAPDFIRPIPDLRPVDEVWEYCSEAFTLPDFEILTI